MFSQKISIIYVWEGSDYASLAASFSRVVNKTTYKDTVAEAHKNFVNFIGKHLCRSLFYNEACNFIINRLSNTVGFLLRAPYFADHIWLLLLEKRNSKNLFKDFSAISLTYEQQICDHFQLSKWKTSLKMHSLTKNLFP